MESPLSFNQVKLEKLNSKFEVALLVAGLGENCQLTKHPGRPVF
jgi:hypothetical protein